MASDISWHANKRLRIELARAKHFLILCSRFRSTVIGGHKKVEVDGGADFQVVGRCDIFLIRNSGPISFFWN